MAFSISQIDLDLEIKITLVGNPSVGKTSIIDQYINKRFELNVSTTIGESHFSKYIRINNENILVTLWDTAGQERYKSLNTIFLKNSNIVIFVYDITNYESFEDIKKIWAPLVFDTLGKDNIVFGLAGNKNDLYFNDKVGIENGKNYAKEINAIFKETTSTNYEVVELYIIELIQKYVDLYSERLFAMKKERKEKKKSDMRCC